MQLSDRDDAERYVGIRVEKMNPEQLMSYVCHQNELRKITLPHGNREREVFKKLLARYGALGQPELAGLLVKWTFFRYDGVFRGEPVGHNHFVVSRPWFCDKMAAEVQEYIRSHATSVVPHRFATAKDIV
jgi:hypothetical protein